MLGTLLGDAWGIFLLSLDHRRLAASRYPALLQHVLPAERAVQAGARCSAPSARRLSASPISCRRSRRPIAAPEHRPCKLSHRVAGAGL